MECYRQIKQPNDEIRVSLGMKYTQQIPQKNNGAAQKLLNVYAINQAITYLKKFTVLSVNEKARSACVRCNDARELIGLPRRSLLNYTSYWGWKIFKIQISTTISESIFIQKKSVYMNIITLIGKLVILLKMYY